MTISAPDLLPDTIADPDWHPHRINADISEILFLHITRNQKRDFTFLEESYFPPDLPHRAFRFRDVELAARGLSPAPVRFIFHSSMAISTLLSRLFDEPGVSANLREPIILNELAALRRRGRNVSAPLQTVLALLKRPYDPGETIVIKPGNTVNILMSELLADPAARALIVHAPLATFLKSIAQKGMAARIIYRRLYALLAKDDPLPTGFSPEDVFEQTDLQVAGMAWLHHQAQFSTTASSRPHQIRTIDSETFLANRDRAVVALFEFFQVPLDLRRLQSTGVFDRHSKESGREFSVAERRQAHDQSAETYSADIQMVTDWVRSVADFVKVPMVLPGSLLR